MRVYRRLCVITLYNYIKACQRFSEKTNVYDVRKVLDCRVMFQKKI